jgi:hypothetical protein
VGTDDKHARNNQHDESNQASNLCPIETAVWFGAGVAARTKLGAYESHSKRKAQEKQSPSWHKVIKKV